MFWGLIMEPQRRYTQTVKKAFHISMAALDVSSSSEQPAQVMCGFQGRNYLLCTLKKPGVMQCPLDLNFEVGSEVSFATNGQCHVHLTGYLNEDPYEDFGEQEEEEEEDEEYSIEDLKTNKRVKNSLENGPPAKKMKNNAAVTSSQNDENEEDSESDDDALLDGEEDEDTDVIEEEEDEEGDDEEDAEEEETEMEESEDDDEEVQVKLPAKQNGVAKKQQQEGKDQKGKKQEAVEKGQKQQQKGKRQTLAGGVIVEDIKEGQGPVAKNGKYVNVYYEGRLKNNNKLFDSTTKGSGFSFKLGNSEVIKAWDIGVAGMKVGGKRKIICPPKMAYGQKGSPPAIPPNSTLVFEVELKKVS